MTDEKELQASLVSINVSDVLGLGKAAEKFTPSAEKIIEGFSRLFSPLVDPARMYLQERAKGAARRHEITKNLQQISEVDRLFPSNPEIADKIRQRLIRTEIRRQENIEAATTKAIGIASGSQKDSPANDIDEDFLQEWAEGVKDISNDDVQTIWASVLASAPSLPSGRVSKPAIELLKQFDHATAISFTEFVKVSWSVGLPSRRLPLNWAPFGSPIRMELLEEMGLIRSETYSAMSLPSLGIIKQGGTVGFNTLVVADFSQRGRELAEAIFTSSFEIDEKLVQQARSENFALLAKDEHWSLEIFLDDGDVPFCVITPPRLGSHSADQAVAALRLADNLDNGWREILLEYAAAGQIKIAG